MGQTKKRKRGRNAKKNDQEVEFVATTEPQRVEQENIGDDDHLVGDQQHNPPDAEQIEERETARRSAGGESDKGVNEEEPEGEVELFENHDEVPKLKKQRGPTRMRDIAKDPTSKVQVNFTEMGEPYGDGSVTLSSYVGALVRDVVPVTVESWKKVSEESKTILWRSVQARFNVTEKYQRKLLLSQMGCLWRAAKSRLVTKINKATNHQQRMNLRPKNVSPFDWRKFVKLKTSEEFKVVSDSYKARRSIQIPHTCSRKGMVRLAQDMKKVAKDPSEVDRLNVWIKSRTKKDGTPVNTIAAEKLKKAQEIVSSGSPSNATNPGEDLLTQLLGPDNPGRMRALGRNMSKTKLACFEVNNHCIADMKEKQVKLEAKVEELQGELAKFKNQRQDAEVGENSAARSVNKKAQPKCILVDWDEDDSPANVAEGRIIASDPMELLNDSPLGPTDVKVLVDKAILPEADLWRATSSMFTIEHAVGQMIAWPAKKCINLEQVQSENIASLGTGANSSNKCKLLDLGADGVVVGEGRWISREPKTLVNGVPIGSRGIKIFLEVIHEPETFIWRPTLETSYLEDCLNSFVAWPYKKIVFEDSTDATCQKSPTQKSTAAEKIGNSSAASGSKSVAALNKSSVSKSTATVAKSPKEKSQLASQSPIRRSPRKKGTEVIKENQKCKLLDIKGKRVVALGRVHSTDPDSNVHCVRLGANAARVWVDVVEIDDAPVWRSSDEMEIIKDAHGSSIAWPMDKLVFY